MKTQIVFSKKCLSYGNGQIESPQRIEAVQRILEERGYVFVEPSPANKECLLKVHSLEYVNGIMNGLLEDYETPSYDNIYFYAALSAGGAILAADTNSFSIMRPPGHHVGKNGSAMGADSRGFCYFNNIAIAVKHLDKSTLILDIDGHHGNGTQEIFQGNEKVVYVSLHRHPEYPGTGIVSEGNCLNFPLEANCGEKVYLKTLDKAICAVDFDKLDVVGISAGFDTYRGDEGSLSLRENTYKKIGKTIAAIGKPTFFVLEGGYSIEKIGSCVSQFLQGYEE